MTEVKVHPHRNLVNANVEACVSITPNKKHGRAYYMGTVYLTGVRFVIHQSGVRRAQAEQVRNVHAWAVGNLAHEYPEQMQPAPGFLAHYFRQVTYHFNRGRFIAVDNGEDVTDKTFKAAIFCGRDFYVSKD